MRKVIQICMLAGLLLSSTKAVFSQDRSYTTDIDYSRNDSCSTKAKAIYGNHTVSNLPMDGSMVLQTIARNPEGGTIQFYFNGMSEGDHMTLTVYGDGAVWAAIFPPLSVCEVQECYVIIPDTQIRHKVYTDIEAAKKGLGIDLAKALGLAKSLGILYP